MVNKMSFSCHRNGQQSGIQLRILYHFHIKNMEMRFELFTLSWRVVAYGVGRWMTGVRVHASLYGDSAFLWIFDLVFYWQNSLDEWRWMTKRIRDASPVTFNSDACLHNFVGRSISLCSRWMNASIGAIFPIFVRFQLLVANAGFPISLVARGIGGRDLSITH